MQHSSRRGVSELLRSFGRKGRNLCRIQRRNRDAAASGVQLLARATATAETRLAAPPFAPVPAARPIAPALLQSHFFSTTTPPGAAGGKAKGKQTVGVGVAGATSSTSISSSSTASSPPSARDISTATASAVTTGASPHQKDFRSRLDLDTGPYDTTIEVDGGGGASTISTGGASTSQDERLQSQLRDALNSHEHRYRESRARNGMRVASLNAISDTSLTVGVWIDAGSRYETRESNGSAHFLEHMTFKGTQKRSRVGLETEVENMGGHLNAYTSREQTVYYAKVFPQDMEHGLDILSDILGKSLITARSVEDERSVITREMEEVEKSVEEVIFDRLHLAAFRDHMLGATILGPVENIHHLEPKHLRNYVETNYTTDRMVVVAVGAVDHDQLLEAVERYFGGFRTDPAGYTPYTRPRWMALGLAPPAAEVGEKEVASPAVPSSSAPGEAIPKPKFWGSELRYSTALGEKTALSSHGSEPLPNNQQLAHFAIAFEGVSWTDPDAVHFMVMQSLLGVFKRDESQKLLPGVFSANPLVRQVTGRLEQELLAKLIESGPEVIQKPVGLEEDAAAAAASHQESEEIVGEKERLANNFDHSSKESSSTSASAASKEDNEAPYYEKYAGMKVTDAIPMMEDAEIAQFQQDRFALLQKADPNFQPAFCEQYSAFNTCYRDTGLFGVHAACHPGAVRPVVEELMFGINRLADGITEAELERAKRELRTILFASQDNTTNLAEEIGRHLLVYGRRIPPAEMDQRLSAITVDEINRVATEYLRGREIAVTALGPIDNMPKLEEIKQMNNMAKA